MSTDPQKKRRNGLVAGAVLLAAGLFGGYQALKPEKPAEPPVVTVPPPAPQPVPPPGPIEPGLHPIPESGRLAYVLAFGFGDRHEPGSVRPLVQPYEPWKREVQRANLAEWEKADVDFATLSWFGLASGQFHERITSMVGGYFTEAEASKSPVKLCIYLESIPGGLERNLAWVKGLTASPAYQYLDGKPVLFIYSRVYGQLLGAGEARNGAEQEQQAAAALPLLAPLADEWFLVFTGLGAPARVPVQERPVGAHWFGLAFARQRDLAERYAAAQARADLWHFPLVYHGFDNRATRGAQQNGGTVWPAGGSSLAHFEEQLGWTLSFGPETIGFPWDECGERSAFVPTSEFGRVYTDAMARAIAEFKRQ